MDSELIQGFLAQAEDYLPTIRSGILICAQTGNTYGELNTSLRQMRAIKDAALIVELDEAARIAGELEEKLKVFTALKTPLTGEQSRGLLDKLTELEASITQLNFNTDNFSLHITDFLDASFENLGLSEPSVGAVVEAEEAADEWEDEFEIDEEMLEIFGEEAEELICNIRVNLARLEKNTDDREALLEVRRNAHTLKGSAGIVGLKELSKVAHRVEDSLDYLAENEIAGNEKIFELLLTSSDCFGALANNETSAQLTKKIAQLYKDFDALMIALKEKEGEKGRRGEEEKRSKGTNEQSRSSVVRNLSEPATGGQDECGVRSAECGIQAENQSEILDLKSEISGERRKTNEEQIAENRKPKTENREVNSQPEIANHKSIVRVSLEKLDDLVKIMSGLVVSRSVFEQRLAELEQQIGELHNSTRRLNFATGKIETDFEADMLNVQSPKSKVQSHWSVSDSQSPNNPQSAIRNPQSFDSLELDRYTEFHQTMRELVETTGDTSAINAELDILKGNLETLFENQRRLIEEMQDKLLRLRMVSFGSLGVRLKRTVRVTADEEGKSAELHVEGENLEIDTQILDALIEPLLHLLRNAVAHGIESPETRRLLGKPETGQIKVRARDEGTHFILTVTDDGRGISAAALKARAIQHGILSEAEADAMSEQEAFALIFHAGLTTAEEISQVSGRGVGMNIVKAAVSRQRGSILIDSESYKGTTFTVRLPLALVVTRALLVKTGNQTYAFPLQLVKHISRLAVADELWSGADNQNQAAANNAQPMTGEDQTPKIKDPESSIFYLNDLLGLPPDTAAAKNENTPLLLLKTSEIAVGLIVDEIVKSEEIVIKSLGNPLRDLPELLGAAILGDGSVVPVLDLMHLLKFKVQSPKSKVQSQEESVADEDQSPKTKVQRPLNILIVDDSPSVRHLTSNIVKNAGWTAIVAKDGLEALDVLQDLRELPDVILSDVEMPRMNGYELLASLKKQTNLQAIPVVMITSRANQKHRQKAVDLGASEYLTKPFDDAKLIEIIKDLSA